MWQEATDVAALTQCCLARRQRLWKWDLFLSHHLGGLWFGWCFLFCINLSFSLVNIRIRPMALQGS